MIQGRLPDFGRRPAAAIGQIGREECSQAPGGRGFCCLPAQALGIEEAELPGLQGQLHRLCTAFLAVQVDGGVPVAVDGETVCLEALYEIAQLLVPAALVLADDEGNLKPGDLFHQQHVELAVCRVCLGYGIEAAAVEPSVAHAHEGHVAVHGLAVDIHRVVLADAPHHVDHRGGGIGGEAVEEGKPFILGHIRADPGVQTHGADVQAQIAVAADHVKPGFLRVHQPLQIEEGFRLAEYFHKVIAAAAAVYGDSGVVESGCAGGHLVEGAVTAAGVDAHFFAGFGGFPGDPAALPRGLGYLNAVVKALTDPINFRGVFSGVIPAAGSGIDDEQMLHGFLVSFPFRRPAGYI